MARPHTSDIGSVSASLTALFKKLEDNAIPVTIDRRHRAAGLLDRLKSLGVTLDERSLKQYLAPVLCVTADDQARFGTILADWFASVRQTRLTSPTGLTDRLRRLDWRYLFLVGLCLVVTVVAVLTWMLTTLKQPIQQPPEFVCKQVPASLCPQSRGLSTSLSEILESLPARLGLASLPIFGLYLTLRFRRRARANIVRRRGKAAASKLFEIPFEGAGLFGDSGSRSAIFALRQGVLAPTHRIDFLRTFAATVRAMGWPSIVFATERTSREVVLFVDQEGLADHIQILARSLQERLLAASSLLTRYDYRLHPGNLRFVSGRLADENVYALDRVVARHAGARLLILSSGDGLFDPSGRLDVDLLPRLAPFASVILLTPTPEANWGERERAFARAGIYVVSATRGGILRAADFLQRDHDEPFLRLQAHIPEGIDPFLTRINRDYYRLSSDIPPDARQIRRIVHDLGQYMADDESFCVLAAIAAFPKLDPGITLALGRLVIGRRVDEEMVAKLARLPWTRDGRMPDWLRIALWNQLPQIQQDKVRAAINVMLDLAEEIQKGQVNWRDMDRRVQLAIARPKTGFLSKVLSDSAQPPGMLGEQLFLDFMQGVQHDPIKSVLEPAAPGGIRRAFDADFARRTMALYVLFGSLALVLFIGQPIVAGLAGSGNISQNIVQRLATWVPHGISGEEPKADRSSESTDQPSPKAQPIGVGGISIAGVSTGIFMGTLAGVALLLLLRPALINEPRPTAPVVKPVVLITVTILSLLLIMFGGRWVSTELLRPQNPDDFYDYYILSFAIMLLLVIAYPVSQWILKFGRTIADTSTFNRKPVFGYLGMVFALIAIGGIAMTQNILVDILLGTILGVALGASIFIAVLFLIVFIGSYVYEKKTPWETKAYLTAFACICVALILLSNFSLTEIYDSPGSMDQFWSAHYLWRALALVSFVVFCTSMFFFLVGPFELAQRIRLQLAPTSNKQQVYTSGQIRTDIPARLDRLPWGAFHTLVAVGLGITWILNGLEVTLAGLLSPALMRSPVLNLSASQVGIANSLYLAGLVLGSLFFGWLTDGLGRKRLFFVTLLVYLLFTALTGLSWNFESLAVFRFFTGTGIGGEYAAINSTIQELIPARFRGRTDLLISGTFWIGAGIGALGSTVLLDPTIMDPELGWRVAFLIGAALALIVLGIRRVIPESPRWLMTHRRLDEAEAIVAGIEDKFRGQLDLTERLPQVQLIGRNRTPLREVVQTVFQVYPVRALVSFSLMAAQALAYNAIFFTHALVLTRFFEVRVRMVGWYFLPFAVGNFLGPLLLGPLFDTLGRKRMISLTYAITGALLAISAYLFEIGAVSALTLSLAWMLTFFFASAAASAAYLTAGEIFPLEIRALAIAFFFAVGTSIGSVSPWLFTTLSAGEAGNVSNLYRGYLVLAMVMILAALIESLWGVACERKPLETVARPLTFVE